MAKLLYVMNVSLDGYIADEDGKLDWTAPDEEFYSFINDLERPVGTYLYGRQLYELMQVWETDPAATPQSPAAREFAEIWQAADKVVYSRTLKAASTTRTRIERDFDPQAVRQLRRPPSVISPWAVPPSAPMRSRPGWWTSTTCSSGPSCWAAASTSSPTGSGSSSNYWTSAGSPTAWCTCATAPLCVEDLDCRAVVTF